MVSGRALMIISLLLVLLTVSFWFCWSLSFDKSEGKGMVGIGVMLSVDWLKPTSLFTDCLGGVLMVGFGGRAGLGDLSVPLTSGVESGVLAL